MNIYCEKAPSSNNNDDKNTEKNRRKIKNSKYISHQITLHTRIRNNQTFSPQILLENAL